MASQYPPKKGAAFTLYFTLYNADGTVIANPGTITKKISKDGGAVADITASVTEEDTTYGQCSVVLSDTEMTADAVWIYIVDDTEGCIPFTATLYTAAQTLDELDTIADTILADTAELQTNQGNWLTATGFSTHSAADVWAVTTRSLTTFGTLVADVWAYTTRTLSAFAFTPTPSNAADVTAILEDTGTTLPAAIAALPTDADVNAACDTALTDYDAPTKAELDSAVAPLALEATVAALNDFDPAMDTVAHVTLVDTTTAVTEDIAADVDLTGLATATDVTNAVTSIKGADGDTLKDLSDEIAAAAPLDAADTATAVQAGMTAQGYTEALSALLGEWILNELVQTDNGDGTKTVELMDGDTILKTWTITTDGLVQTRSAAV